MTRSTVVHVFASVDRGGAETRTLEAIDHPLAKAVSHEVVVVGNRPGGSLAHHYEAAGVVVHHLPLKDPRSLLRWARLIRQIRPRVVHSHIGIFAGPVLSIARLGRVPIRITHFRSDKLDLPPIRGRGLLLAYLRWMIRRNSTTILGVSPSALETWSKDWKTDVRCRVLISGLRLEPYELPGRFDIRGLFSLPDDAYVVLHVGRDIPSKRRDLAMRIMTYFENCDPSVNLVFLGRSDNVTKPERITENVFAHPEVPSVAPWLKDADALLMTSSVEGMPGVLLEAKAAGLGVCATALPGVRYLGRRLSGVREVASDESVATWVQALRLTLPEASRTSDLRRQEGIRELREQGLDLDSTIKSYLVEWGVTSDQESDS